MIEAAKLSEFRAFKQGLIGKPFAGKESPDILDATGWGRSVGGASPYLHFYSRAGLSRETVDADVKSLMIHELPTARGCAYLLPSRDFALGLACNRHPNDPVVPTSQEKQLGITSDQIDALCKKVLELLAKGDSLDPKQTRDVLGEAIVNYGEEGKKRGITTDLPGALGRLQASGKIRRIPTNGRLDQERYSYTIWEPSPMAGFSLEKPEIIRNLLQRYVSWVGPASADEFKWFSGAGVRDCKAAIEAASVTERDGYWADEETWREFFEYKSSQNPDIRFIGCLDNLFLLTRNIQLHVADADKGREAVYDKKPQAAGGLSDLANNAIVDRGRLIGLWDYDPDNKEIVWNLWDGDFALAQAQAQATETFIRDQLGDARTFSLDAPKSRRARLAALRG